MNTNNQTNATGSSGGQGSTNESAGTPSTSSNPPRATNAAALFAKSQSTEIKSKMRDKRSKEGQTVQQANFNIYRAVTKEMFEAQPEEVKIEFENRAAAFNEARQQKPPIEHIYE